MVTESFGDSSLTFSRRSLRQTRRLEPANCRQRRAPSLWRLISERIAHRDIWSLCQMCLDHPRHFRAMHIEGRPDCSIYWHPDTGAHEVFGAIRGKWAELGWETGTLGSCSLALPDVTAVVSLPTL